MKKKVLFVSVLFIFSLIITGCGVKKEVMTDALKFKNEYEKLNGKSNDVGKDYRKIKIKEDNPFVYATASEIVQKMEEQKTFAVYFGYSSCPWCRS